MTAKMEREKEGGGEDGLLMENQRVNRWIK